ncbi:MAG: methylated-DNA--[protein]-cysteine S-methyltransferase [Ilumatobacter sp.]
MTDLCPLAHRDVESPIGPLRIVASSFGVRAILWPDDQGRVPTATSGGAPSATEAAAIDAHLERAAAQLAEYFVGSRVDFDLDLDPVGTEFQQQAWAALRAIPHGETVSYGEQARRLGDPNKARAVGAANGKNPISIVVPCHRVVGSNGALTGFAGGLDTKRWLLDHESRVAGTTLL